MMFDASAIYALINLNKVELIKNGRTLELAIYEFSNILWKKVSLDKEMSLKEGMLILRLFKKVLVIMEVSSILGNEEEILKLASKYKLSFYDASYLYLAIRNKEPLATEDRVLYEIAKKFVKTYTVSQLTKVDQGKIQHHSENLIM
jgi:predicted nucleic acid-binding protein